MRRARAGHAARRILGALALVAALTAATPYEEASGLFREGSYLEAAELAAAGGTADDFALAARAVLAHAIYVAPRAQRAAYASQGREYARQALAIDPGNVEAHLQYVIALHRSELPDIPPDPSEDALPRDIAQEAKSHIDRALEIDPASPWAHSMLAGWHFEIVRRAGPVLAEVLYGASVENGRAAFEKAIDLLPGSIVLRYEFAHALLLIDSAENRKDAAGLLRVVTAAAPQDRLEEILARRARALLDAMASGNPEALRTTLERLSQ